MLPPLRHPGCASEATPPPGHGQPLAAHRSTGFQPVCLPASHRAHAIFAPSPPSRRRLRLTVAGHSPGSLHAGLRSLDAALAFAIVAALGQQRRLPGTGSPSLPPVAQVVNLCASRMHRFSTCVHLGFASRSVLSSEPLKSSGGMFESACRTPYFAIGAEQPGSRTPSSASMRLAPARGPRVAPRTTPSPTIARLPAIMIPGFGGMVVAAAPV